jgi:hypothetical protein
LGRGHRSGNRRSRCPRSRRCRQRTLRKDRRTRTCCYYPGQQDRLRRRPRCKAAIDEEAGRAESLSCSTGELRSSARMWPGVLPAHSATNYRSGLLRVANCLGSTNHKQL